MELIVIGSSSSGNSVAVRCDGGVLLIDAGFSLRTIRERLASEGVGLDELRGLLVTHEHADHARGAGRFLRLKGAGVAANEGTAAALRTHFGLQGVRPLKDGELAEVGPFGIRPIRVPHDSADCSAFEVRVGDLRLLYATDLGHVPAAVVEAGASCDAAVFESNHDRAMLWGGSYPQFLKERIAGGRGHLSNDQSAEAIARMAKGKLRHVVLAHLSERNNRPERALETVRAGLRNGAPLDGYSVRVEAAPKDGPMRVTVR
jgi:phosphoribosyl 1,2-cyclic phosphodiesterase